MLLRMDKKLVNITICWCTVLVAAVKALTWDSGYTYDLCQTKSLEVNAANVTGTLIFNGSSLNNNILNIYGCVVKIESCGACRVVVEPITMPNLDCASGQQSIKYCSKGCDFLGIFDVNYMNKTLRYYQNHVQMAQPFRSTSSSIFVMLCHSGQPTQLALSFKTIDKLVNITGHSDTLSASGSLSSPFFPEYYAQNHDVYTYHITSLSASDFVKLTFDDWHLSDASTVYFEGTGRDGQFYGPSVRPVVVSEKNWLKVVFSTGLGLTAGENRQYLGFRASYTFASDRSALTVPRTDCDSESYYMNSVGGKIEFTSKNVEAKLYDCLWVVKTKEGFDGIYVKVIRFSTPNEYVYRGDNELTLFEGIASTGNFVQSYDILDRVDNGVSHRRGQGFYIRLKAVLRSSDQLVLAFASYKLRQGCGGYMFGCNNGFCIDPALKCDGVDHCGDNTDERQGCKSETELYGDGHYQYTVTIGVIVPIVISVFLVMVICLLFVMIRRCRRAQLRQMSGQSEDRLPTVSEDVASRRGHRRRRRRRGLFGPSERDHPPTYDEAMQNPPGWYLNVAFGNPVDPTLPHPPTYEEAITRDDVNNTTQNQSSQRRPSSVSSQSELTVCSDRLSDSSSSSDEGLDWGASQGDGEGRRGRRGRHQSSGESDSDSRRSHCREAVDSPEHAGRRSSVATSRENLQNSDVTRIKTAENMTRLETGEGSEERTRVIAKKVSDDDFIVPSGPKPGENSLIPDETAANRVRPIRQGLDLQPRFQQRPMTAGPTRPVKQESDPTPRAQTRTGYPGSAESGRQGLDPVSANKDRPLAAADAIQKGLGVRPRAQPRKQSQNPRQSVPCDTLQQENQCSSQRDQFSSSRGWLTSDSQLDKARVKPEQEAPRTRSHSTDQHFFPNTQGDGTAVQHPRPKPRSRDDDERGRRNAGKQGLASDRSSLAHRYDGQPSRVGVRSRERDCIDATTSSELGAKARPRQVPHFSHDEQRKGHVDKPDHSKFTVECPKQQEVEPKKNRNHHITSPYKNQRMASDSPSLVPTPCDVDIGKRSCSNHEASGLENKMVVNVDTDDIIFIDDSPDKFDSDKQGGKLKSDTVSPWSSMQSIPDRQTGSNKDSRRLERERQEKLFKTKSETGDLSVTSAGGQDGQHITDSERHLHQSYVSLNSDLEEMEDVFV